MTRIELGTTEQDNPDTALGGDAAPTGQPDVAATTSTPDETRRRSNGPGSWIRRSAHADEDRKGSLGRNVLRLVSLLVFIGLWWLIAELEIWKPVFVPHPSAVWGRFIESVTLSA